MPNIAPNNLPVEGKSLLDNFSKDSGNEDRLEPVVNPGAPAPRPSVVSPVEPPKTLSSVERPVDDIFSDMKEAPAAPRPAMGPAVPPMARPVRGDNSNASNGARIAEKMHEKIVLETPRQGFGKILITVGMIVIFTGIVVGGGYWGYNNLLKPKPLNPSLNLSVPENLNATPSAETQQPVQPAAEPVVVDSDNDGLLDTEEQLYATDPVNPDTDGDRLFDGEEINVYKTDPLNKDTDGDGFDDGSEVQNGYDPKGPGKLIRIPAGQ